MKFINYKNFRPVNLDLVESFYCQDYEDPENANVRYKIIFQFASGNITIYPFQHEEERNLLYDAIVKIKSLEVFIG